MKGKVKISYELIMFLILAALVVLFGILTGGIFFNPSVILGTTSDIAYLGIMAMPMTFVILTSGIDLSVGFMMVSSAMVFSVVYQATGYNLLIAAAACLLSGFVFGSVNGVIAARTKINPWLITMSTMYIFQSITWFFGTSYAFSTGYAITDFGYGTIGIVPTQLIVLLLVFAVFYILDKKTTFGRYVHAIGYNEHAVNYSGVNANKMKYFVYMIMGVVCALSAMMYLGKSWQVNQTTAVNMNIEVIALVVLGGTSTAGGVGGVTGTLFAALIVGVLKRGLALMGLGGDIYNFVLGGVLIASQIMFAYLEKKKKIVSREMAIKNMDE